MSRNIVWTTKFKKDYKLAIKCGLNINLLDNIIRALARGDTLPEKKQDVLVLTLSRTGTHSDLFDKS